MWATEMGNGGPASNAPDETPEDKDEDARLEEEWYLWGHVVVRTAEALHVAAENECREHFQIRPQLLTGMPPPPAGLLLPLPQDASLKRSCCPHRIWV